MIQLRTKNLKKYYQRGPHLIKALDGIDLEVERGCFLAVMGISGSGKSTLLHLLGGLDEPTEGRVQIGEVVWWTATTGSNCTGIDRKTPSCSGG